MDYINKNRYHAIIIGAGVAGLTCGLYLAKEDRKVLIIEQHNKPGGYCSSFRRKGFIFDSSIHYLGSCREEGWIGKFLSHHDLWQCLKMKRANPSDVVILGNMTIPIYNDIKRTIHVLADYFPQENDNIKAFFKFVIHTPFVELYRKLKNMCFQKLLSYFFKEEKLKNIFSLLIGNMELPPSKASALAICILFREFILDGGYYPQGGMQNFSNALLQKFLNYGGEIKFSSKVNEILVKNDSVVGVKMKNSFIYSDTIIASCDAHQLFKEMVPVQYRNKKVISKIENLVPSSSVFIVYLGLRSKLDKRVRHRCSTWFLPEGDLKTVYSFFIENKINFSDSFVFCAFPSFYDPALAPTNSEVMFCIIGAPFLSEKYWSEHREMLSKNVINRVEKLIPNIGRIIEVKEIATPHTLYKYTSNYNGALSGWANLPEQIDASIMPYKTYLKNLYMCGHWTTSGFGQGGIGMVVYSGYNTARAILKKRGE